MAETVVSRAIARTRPTVARLLFSDTYRVERRVEVADDSGGRTTAWVAVEAGAGLLRRAGLRGETRAVAERLGWTSYVEIDLPLDTIADERDRILIDGRAFTVGHIDRAATLELMATAVAQEQG
jgi:hypothetical protein